MEKLTASRRQFLKRTGATSSLAAAALTSMAPLQGQPVAASDVYACLDYRRSFICGTSELNSVRFWIESRTTMIDNATGEKTVFYQCASCKSENTFGESDLFLADNYDFLPIFGDGHWLIFRRHARMDPDRYRQTVESPNAWGEPKMLLHSGTSVQVLDNWEKIRDATAQGMPLVSQTELANQDSSLTAIIECPVKTMNISLENQMYQVDTGPVAFPDLSRGFNPLVDCLSLAFVAFNQADFADFVIEQPTAVLEDEQKVCSIYHYSNPISLPAVNRVLTHE